MREDPATPGCEDLARQWLAAEERVRLEPANEALAQAAATLGEAYDEAVNAASLEELRLSWEAAQRVQAGEEIGGRSWADARRVSELLRTEYLAAHSRDDATGPDGAESGGSR